jgi:hypothetical protein
VSYASWPYDESTRNDVNTLRGRFRLSQDDEATSAAYRTWNSVQRESAAPAEPYQFSIATLVREARDRRY